MGLAQRQSIIHASQFSHWNDRALSRSESESIQTFRRVSLHTRHRKLPIIFGAINWPSPWARTTKLRHIHRFAGHRARGTSCIERNPRSACSCGRQPRRHTSRRSRRTTDERVKSSQTYPDASLQFPNGFIATALCRLFTRRPARCHPIARVVVRPVPQLARPNDVVRMFTGNPSRGVLKTLRNAPRNAHFNRPSLWARCASGARR